MVYSDIPAGYALPVDSIGKSLRRLREARHLTQDDLAERSLVKQADISKWETDKATPTVKSLLRLSVGLEVPLDEVVKGWDAGYDDLIAAISPSKASGGTANAHASARVHELERRINDYEKKLAEVQDVASRLIKIAALDSEVRTTTRAQPESRKRDRKAG